MAHTKCAGYTGRTSDVLAKGHNLGYCCEPCLEVAYELSSFMRQTRDDLKGVIKNSPNG